VGVLVAGSLAFLLLNARAKKNRPLKNILLVFADPKLKNPSQPLNQVGEYEAIRRSIRDNKEFNLLAPILGATINEVTDALDDTESYWIIHFSAHGSSTGIFLEDDDRAPDATPLQIIVDTISKLKVECLILSACYAGFHDTLQASHIPYVIAPQGAISDSAAVEFARKFYDALCEGKSLEQAYDAGRLLSWDQYPDTDIPILYGPGRF
jgi:CHAT domain-containing protein